MALDPVTAGVDLIKTLIDKFFPDKTQAEKDQMAQVMAQIQVAADAAKAQADINKQEAANSSLFVAGWRPAVGWVCAIGFGVQFAIAPLAEWFTNLVGHPVKFPAMDMSTLMPLLLGMLGLGGMRTFEKVNGVTAGH
jgi:Holin of 3TMs, for gene-transfer release